MSTSRWPTSSRFAVDRASETLRPYRVEVGDAVYDQREFVADTEHRFHNYTSGIGAGKTVAGIMRAATNAEEWNAGTLGMIVTPTSLGVKNVILPELSKWGFLDSWEYRGPQSERPGLHLPNGSRILLESADNKRKIERLRGPSISWFWMDEAALIPEKAWRILVGRLRTGQYRNAFVTTTPKGFNWIYKKFVDEGSRLESVNNVLGVPSFANPHLPLDYRREILEEYEGSFHAQEVLGEFTKSEGLVYGWFREETHVVGEPPGSVNDVFYGVDWGHNNPAVILVIGDIGDGFVVLDEFYESKCTTPDLISVAKGFVEEYGRGRLYCDPSEPSNVEEFQHAGLDAVQGLNDVQPGISRVSSVRDRLWVLERCQAVINEFGLYRYSEKEGSDAVVELNDHAMDALRYALFTRYKRGSGGVHVVGGEWSL